MIFYHLRSTCVWYAFDLCAYSVKYICMQRGAEGIIGGIDSFWGRHDHAYVGNLAKIKTQCDTVRINEKPIQLPMKIVRIL